MKPTFALLAVFAAAAAHAGTLEPTARSGGFFPLAPQQFDVTRIAACADQVFHDNLDGDAGHGCVQGSGAVQVYTDRAAFLAALAPGYIDNTFDDVTPGMSGALQYAKAGYEYTVFTQLNRRGGLYNGPGFISTDRVSDAVTLYFLSGNPVHALGADLWPSDFSLRPVAGTIEIDIWLEDGTIETVTPAGPGNFSGFVSANSPIVMVVIDAPDLQSVPAGESPDRWSTLDNLVIGDVP
jgi:hypothetical protein